MMQRILHETCQQYVARRLSEGWGIVWQKGCHLILSSPDGNVLRPVDLRNDVETLRPSAPGDETNLLKSGSPPAPTNWESVDEVVADEGVTTVLEYEMVWKRDLYNLPASSASGTINHIKVYVRCWGDGGLPDPKTKVVIRSNTTTTEDVEQVITDSYVTYSKQWDTNPADSEAWEVADLADLQIGVALKGGGFDGIAACTQVYVEVDYNPAKTSSDTGSGTDAKKTGNPLATYSRSETGSGAEAMPARGLFTAQSGSGLEHILDRALVLISESGSGVDTVLSFLRTLISDSGTGVENSYLHILEGVKDSSDSGSGVEASSLTTLFQRDETGEAVESVVARALFSREPQMGAIDLARVITAAITGTGETGSGAEASLVSYYQKKADSGGGVDSSTLEALFAGEDSGVGAEAITLLAAMIAHDTGQGVEAVLSYLRKLVDSGEGAEVVQLIGAVGRRMRMKVYQLEAFNLKVYTSEVGK